MQVQLRLAGAACAPFAAASRRLADAAFVADDEGCFVSSLGALKSMSVRSRPRDPATLRR